MSTFVSNVPKQEPPTAPEAEIEAQQPQSPPAVGAANEHIVQVPMNDANRPIDSSSTQQPPTLQSTTTTATTSLQPSVAVVGPVAPPSAPSAPPLPPPGITQMDFDEHINAAPGDFGDPYFGFVLSGPVVGLAAVTLAFAIIMPAFSQSTRSEDLLALLCLLPSCGAAVWAYNKRHSLMKFRQLFIRFCVGWLVLLPLSWFIGLTLSMLWYLLFAILAVFFLPIVIAVIFFILGLFTSIAAVEECLKMAVAHRNDNFNTIPSPEFYPLYSSATALGLGAGASYYLVIFLRVIIDAVTSYAGCDNDGSSNSHYPASMAGFGSSGSSSSGSTVGTEHLFLALQSASTTMAPLSSRSHADDCGVQMGVATIIVLVAGCVFFAQPVQLLASYHLGLVAARVEVLKESATVVQGNRSIAFTICFRGFFLAAFVMSLIFTGLWSFLIAILLSAGYLVYVKRYEKNMPRDYLERVGYLNLFGYGALSQIDDDTPTTVGAPAATAQGAHAV